MAKHESASIGPDPVARRELDEAWELERQFWPPSQREIARSAFKAGFQSRRAELDVLRAEANWQPIETCPLDGLFLVYEDGAMRMMYRTRGEWQATANALDQYGDPDHRIKVRETGVYEPS